jgi:hypothetical protein
MPKKLRETPNIVSTKAPKWPRWTKFWYYHRFCSDSDVLDVKMNNECRASPLVSQMTAFEGCRRPSFTLVGDSETRAGELYILTLHCQMSLDLVEEFVALVKHYNPGLKQLLRSHSIHRHVARRIGFRAFARYWTPCHMLLTLDNNVCTTRHWSNRIGK